MSVSEKTHRRRRFFFGVFIVLGVSFIAYTYGIPCFFHAVIGLPSPGCGMTRALIAALHGRFAQAFFFHPLWVIIPPIVLLLLFHSQPWHHFSLVERIMHWDALWWVLFILVMVVYIIRMIMFFPDTPPLDLNRNSLFLRLIRQIRSGYICFGMAKS